MKRVMMAAAILLGIGVALVLGHLALIEIGREVVTLRTRLPGAGWQETRLWVVDYDGAVWLHSAGKRWLRRFDGDPIVELERHGEVRRYRAHALPGPHLEIDRLLREKYGFADRWVRFLVPCDEDTVPVRLEPLPRDGG
jgi:hypothetical protein